MTVRAGTLPFSTRCTSKATVPDVDGGSINVPTRITCERETASRIVHSEGGGGPGGRGGMMLVATASNTGKVRSKRKARRTHAITGCDDCADEVITPPRANRRANLCEK